MTEDVYIVRCTNCNRSVSVKSVSEFHNVGGFRGYSYTVSCQCGAVSHHDGNDGERIPDSLKRAAAVRERAFTVLGKIDFQRRDLPSSNGKSMLKGGRLRIPESQGDDEWLVYRFSNEMWITYCLETDIYTVHKNDSTQAFSNAQSLAANLPVG